MKIITFSLLLPPATLQLWNKMWIQSYWLGRRLARIVKTSLVKTSLVAGGVTKKELSSGIFSGNFQTNCPFKMFWEKHYHMTLSNKTPPQRFLRKRDMFRLFLGLLFHRTALRDCQIIIWLTKQITVLYLLS